MITFVGCITSTPVNGEFSDRLVFNKTMAVRRIWRCRGCGEAIDNHFDICWKCGETNSEVSSAESVGAENVDQEVGTRGIGFFKWRNTWITVPLGLLFLCVAFVLGYSLFEDWFRG